MERFIRILIVAAILLYFSDKEIFNILLYSVLGIELMILMIKQLRKRMSRQYR